MEDLWTFTKELSKLPFDGILEVVDVLGIRNKFDVEGEFEIDTATLDQRTINILKSIIDKYRTKDAMEVEF